MNLSELLEARLEEQGITKFALAKKIAEVEGPNKNPRSYTSRIAKLMADPKGRIFSNLEQVVKLLGGEIIIRWNNHTDHTIS
ncbi:MAG: hypothetical protein F6K31_04390 [Symploca sp. SIO2G7]|nr:hypothetical protein [Symploca sp. SIO2G7]